MTISDDGRKLISNLVSVEIQAQIPDRLDVNEVRSVRRPRCVDLRAILEFDDDDGDSCDDNDKYDLGVGSNWILLLLEYERAGATTAVSVITMVPTAVCPEL